MPRRRRYAIGVDIGGTKTAVGIVDLSGRVKSQAQFATGQASDARQFVLILSGAIHALLTEKGLSPSEMTGIGVGAAGPLDIDRGVIKNPFTLPSLDGYCLTRPLANATGLPCRLENDADVALLGEAWVGSARGVDSVVMLTFGTGVGGAVLSHGRLYRGTQNEHPELGHVPVRAAGPLCYCGRRGCLESIASGSAIARAGRRLGLKDSAAVFDAAANGDTPCTQIIERALAASATAIWSFLHSFAPRRIILGGGIMDSHYRVIGPALQKTISHAAMLGDLCVQIRPARLGNRAGVIGAASMYLNRQRVPDADTFCLPGNE